MVPAARGRLILGFPVRHFLGHPTGAIIFAPPTEHFWNMDVTFIEAG